jgi:hypothetical protein
MFRLAADVRLRAEVLLSLRLGNRSARPASRMCFAVGGRGGGRLGGRILNNQVFSKPNKT